MSSANVLTASFLEPCRFRRAQRCVQSWAEIGVFLDAVFEPEDIKAKSVLMVTFPKASTEQLPKRITIT